MARITTKPAPAGPTTPQLLHAAYERRAAEAAPCSDQDWRRDHLGASILGHQCDRYLWLSFRWAVGKKLDGRTLRLLERGKREESWLVDDLRAMGVEVWDRDPKTGEQYRVRWGHVGGGCDFVMLGLTEAPEVPHLGELKTSNLKQFERLKEKGVKAAKPEHYVQMQVYMHGLQLTHALYLCVCKDNDDIYSERVAYDQAVAERSIARGQRLAVVSDPPDRQESAEFPPCMLTSKDGTQWPCQFHDQCWKGGIPEKNCRTCVSASPNAMDDCTDGLWSCEHHNHSLNPMQQRAGCNQHLSIPAIVGHQVAKVDGRQITYQAADGSVVVDGAAP